MKKAAILLLSLSLMHSSYPMKSPETKGDQPIFFGLLTTQEDNRHYVTNISIGRSADSDEKILLYEKPKNLAPSQQGNIIPGNPMKDLTTSIVELQKIESISVPEPHTVWKWTNQEDSRSVKLTYEFIEVAVKWRSGSTINYLIELGPENSRRPVKIFCDVVDKELDGSIRQGDKLFCPGIKKADLRKKGAPFQSIKILTLDEPCYKMPEPSNGTKTTSKKD